MESNKPYAAPQPTESAPNAYLSHGFPRRRMRFWRIERLKAEMLAQPLSEREALPYLVVYVALFTLASGLPTPGFNVLDAIESVVGIAIAVFGTIFIYRQNGGIDGQFFLQRYFAIGLVVSLRSLVVIVAGMFVLMAVLDSSGQLSDETSVYDFLYMLVAEAAVYWRIGYHVRRLAISTTNIPLAAEP